MYASCPLAQLPVYKFGPLLVNDVILLCYVVCDGRFVYLLCRCISGVGFVCCCFLSVVLVFSGPSSKCVVHFSNVYGITVPTWYGLQFFARLLWFHLVTWSY